MNSQSLYDQWHSDVSHLENQTGLHLSEWHHTALALLPSALENMKVLEIGCGRGDFSMALAQRGALVSGTDFSSSAVKIAAEKARKLNVTCEFSVADAQALSFESESFDVVVSCETLEHVPNPETMLREVQRVLKRGGTFVLTTENYSNGMILLWLQTWLTGKPFNSGGLPQPVEHFFVFWKIRRWLKNCGFTLTAMKGTHHVFLILPRLKPDTFVKKTFRSAMGAGLFRPLARHMAYRARKP